MNRAGRSGNEPRGAPGASSGSAVSGVGRKRWWVAGTLMALSVVAGTLLLTVLGRGLVRQGQRGLSPLPPPSPSRTLEQPTQEDFVGAATCGECHDAAYRKWLGSTHARAGGPPESDRLLAAFDGRQLNFRDAVVTPLRTAGGAYAFVVEQELWPADTVRVEAVVGGGHMVGGGTQSFFSRFPDGTVRFIPFDYHVGEGVWFCHTGNRAGGGWVPISRELSLWNCTDWPPTRAMGTGGGMVTCQECHGSQIEARFEGGEVPYRTRWTALAVNCESCHGPGGQHVAWARAGTLGDSPDIGIAALYDLSVDGSLETCFRCHALKEDLGPTGFLPGKPFAEHYALLYSQLGDRPYFPDGRIRTFGYQGTHLASDCFLNGGMTCLDCHDPHGQGYRDVNGAVLEGRFTNGQCTACHASKADPLEAHTHHPVGSPGSLCVSCHMPYLQQPAMGSRLRYARSDHTIAIPRPTFDGELGLETACMTCHQERSTEELDAQVTNWYGKLKPLEDPVLGILRSEDVRDRRQAAELLLQPGARHPMAQFAALARFMEEFLEPDLPWLEGEVVAYLMELAREDDLDVRTLALAALHLARGRDAQVRGFLSDRLEEAGALERATRLRWVLGLGYLGDTYRKRAEYERAIAAYEKALEILPDDARLLRVLGLTYSTAGRARESIRLLERSLAVDSLQPLVLTDLGVLRAEHDDVAGARDAWMRAIGLNPWEPAANVNLGHLYQFDGRMDNAVAAYLRAAEADPSLFSAHLGLATAYSRQGRFDQAEASAARGVLTSTARSGGN